MTVTKSNPVHLKRDFGAGSAIFLVIANMIGTGIFTTSGFLIQTLPNPLVMVLCWAVGGVLALCGALCYAELGTMFPMAGGEYVFLRKSFGRLPAFLSGWISLIVGFSAPIAAAAIAFATYAFQVIPECYISNPNRLFISHDLVRFTPITLLAIAVIVIFSLIHRHGLHLGGKVQNVLTLGKILVIIIFSFAGLFLGQGAWGHLNCGVPADMLFSGGFATALIIVSFAYSGWNAAAYLGAEIERPAENIPFALIRGTLLVILLYMLLNIVFIYALGPEGMTGVIEVGAKSAVALFGTRIGGLFSAAITLCLLSVISAMIMAGPRIYYAMAKDGIFFKPLAKVSKVHYTPGFSILLQTIIAILMVLTASFDNLLIYIGFTLSLFTSLTVLGLIFLRIRHPDKNRPYKTPGYPVTPALYILLNLWIIIFSVKENPVVFLYGAATILAGTLVYFLFRNHHNFCAL